MRAATEGDGRNLLDPRHRDQDERHKKDQAERQRERRTEDEIVPVPIGEHRRNPGADAVGGCRQQQRLKHRRLHQRQNRQRHQDTDQERDRSELPVIGIDDRTGPGKFRLARGVEDAPVRTNAALEEFPGLIDRLDDVVFHPDGFGAGDEVAQHACLLERSGIGIAQIVAGAWPAEFGDHDALAREFLAKQAVEIDRLVDCLLVGEIFPIGQHVGCDEVDIGGELRIVAPDVPDLARGDGNIDRLLDPLDQLDQVLDLLFAAIHRLVADDDADDIAVLARKIDRGLDLALVAVNILVDPGADRDLESKFGGDRRHHFHASGRGVEADRARHGRQLLQVGANFLRTRHVVDVGMGGALEWRVGNAGQHAIEVGRLLLLPENTPQGCVGGADKQEDGNDGAHRELNLTGHGLANANLSPRFDRYDGKLKDKPATPLNNWYDAVAFLRAVDFKPFRQATVPIANGGYFAAGEGEADGCGEAAGWAAAEPEVVAAGAAAAAACGWAPGLIQQ